MTRRPCWWLWVICGCDGGRIRHAVGVDLTLYGCPVRRVCDTPLGWARLSLSRARAMSWPAFQRLPHLWWPARSSQKSCPPRLGRSGRGGGGSGLPRGFNCICYALRSRRGPITPFMGPRWFSCVRYALRFGSLSPLPLRSSPVTVTRCGIFPCHVTRCVASVTCYGYNGPCASRTPSVSADIGSAAGRGCHPRCSCRGRALNPVRRGGKRP